MTAPHVHDFFITVSMFVISGNYDFNGVTHDLYLFDKNFNDHEMLNNSFDDIMRSDLRSLEDSANLLFGPETSAVQGGVLGGILS